MIPHYRKAWVSRRAGKDGWWVGWYEPTGHRRTRRFPTKALAEAARREVEHRLNSWLGRDADVTSLGDAIKRYCGALETRSPAYRRRMAIVLASFEAITGIVVLSDCTTAAVETWLAKRKVKPATLHSEFAHLKAFFGWCVNADLLETNPLARIPRPAKPQILKRSAEDADWLALLETCSRDPEDGGLPGIDRQAWYLLILLAVVTGLRRSALLSIRTADVDLGDDATDGCGVLRAFTPKTHRESLHGLPAAVVAMLTDRIAVIGSPRLFPWSAWPRKQWDRLRAAAGYGGTFHSLRATSAARAAIARLEAAGAEQLGHSGSRVYSDHYADHRRFALAAARHVQLPPLPPLPPATL